jgi:hypothetical protein
MANRSSSSGNIIESKPKKTRQGAGANTKYTSTSRKRYRGQGN